MSQKRRAHDGPLVFAVVADNRRGQALCRALERVWDRSEILLSRDIRQAMAFLIGRSLEGNSLYPDITFVDLSACGSNGRNLIETVRSVAWLQFSPVVALVDEPRGDAQRGAWCAGADLVMCWRDVETRIGEAADFAVDRWLIDVAKPQPTA